VVDGRDDEPRAGVSWVILAYKRIWETFFWLHKAPSFATNSILPATNINHCSSVTLKVCAKAAECRVEAHRGVDTENQPRGCKLGAVHNPSLVRDARSEMRDPRSQPSDSHCFTRARHARRAAGPLHPTTWRSIPAIAAVWHGSLFCNAPRHLHVTQEPQGPSYQ